MLHGYSAYSGVTLRAKYTVGGGPTELQNDVPVSGLTGVQGSEQFYKIAVPSGATSLVVTTVGGSGDMDLYVRYGQSPTLSVYDCRPYIIGNDETCSFANPQSGDWYIMLHGYSAYSGVTLRASFLVFNSDYNVFCCYAVQVNKK
jgi:hypothetical protein